MRSGREGVRVLVLHDERYDEWRLPKGKLEAGETAAQAAHREVLEETGLCSDAGRYLGATSYSYADPVHGALTHKVVYFFLMSAQPSTQVIPEAATFDCARWLAPHEACECLTWPNEADMVLRAVAQPS